MGCGLEVSMKLHKLCRILRIFVSVFFCFVFFLCISSVVFQQLKALSHYALVLTCLQLST